MVADLARATEGSVLVALVQLVEYIPVSPVPPSPRRRGRPAVSPERLFLKALVIMLVRHLAQVHTLLAVLEEPAPEDGGRLLTEFERPLMAFEPATAGQQALHAETLRASSRNAELRRERLFSVGTGLPAVVWWVLLIGAALNIGLTYLFAVERPGAHLLLTLALTVFVALLIFLIAAMDHPFRGEFSVGPDAFRTVRQQMLT